MIFLIDSKLHQIFSSFHKLELFSKSNELALHGSNFLSIQKLCWIHSTLEHQEPFDIHILTRRNQTKITAAKTVKDDIHRRLLSPW